jgi:hypothetical protein
VSTPTITKYIIVSIPCPALLRASVLKAPVGAVDVEAARCRARDNNHRSFKPTRDMVVTDGRS